MHTLHSIAQHHEQMHLLSNEPHNEGVPHCESSLLNHTPRKFSGVVKTRTGRNNDAVLAGETSASARSGSEQAERVREEQEQEPRAKRRSAQPYQPTIRSPPQHVPAPAASTLAPENLASM